VARLIKPIWGKFTARLACCGGIYLQSVALNRGGGGGCQLQDCLRQKISVYQIMGPEAHLGCLLESKETDLGFAHQCISDPCVHVQVGSRAFLGRGKRKDVP
jgi:hypothetical protein